MNRLIENIASVNPLFLDQVELSTLLTTQIENLHAVSHFKHETFSVLNYAQDFGTIVKESLRRITQWAAKYYTHTNKLLPIPFLLLRCRYQISQLCPFQLWSSKCQRMV